MPNHSSNGIVARRRLLELTQFVLGITPWYPAFFSSSIVRRDGDQALAWLRQQAVVAGRERSA
jgi:hypothetical protein